jgi:reactive intermediate/imine deaminase
MSGLDPNVALGLIVPGMPHPLLCPDAAPDYRAIRDAYDAAARRIADSDADILVLYSTGWASVIGHQIQADPAPTWTHVDPEFHDLGSMPYELRMDPGYAAAWDRAAKARGLHTRTVAYKGFPIDTGTIVALQLLNPGNRLPACVVSCNMYADRAETLVLAKAARDALEATGRKAAVVAVSALSARMHSVPVPPEQDRISSPKDAEWNAKLLEILGEGRLEDTSQLMRAVAAEAFADSKGKAIWWLGGIMGQHNRYRGEVLGHGAIQGTGAAVVALTHARTEAGGHEFDEDDVDVYRGDRNVLGVSPGEAAEVARAPVSLPPSAPRPAPAPAPVAQAPTKAAPAAGVVNTDTAPKPVGAYPHARRVGDLLFLSGVGPRQPGTDAIPGGPIRDADGNPLDYDIEAQTRAVIENVRRILEASGSSLDRVLDITAFLVDMDRDFQGYNKVYAETFSSIQATRTTLAIRALPTPIAVEFKVLAAAGDAP